MQTIEDIANTILKVDPRTGKVTNARKRISIAEGMTKRKPPLKPGLVDLTPEQALAVYVERVSVDGEGAVAGYQRRLTIQHARRIARALAAGKDVGEVTLGLDNERLFATDGQHRLIACVIAKRPIKAVIRPMTKPQRAERFASQSQAKRVTADVLVLAGANPIHRYVQRAVASRSSGRDHTWANLVGEKSNLDVMGPSVAYQALVSYTTNNMVAHSIAADDPRIGAFTAEVGDELAQLLHTFGTKRTNPLAFRPVAIRAIAATAVLAIMRTGRHSEDVARWTRHMAGFDWMGYAYLKRGPDITEHLVKHWNKRLSANKKIFTP